MATPPRLSLRARQGAALPLDGSLLLGFDYSTYVQPVITPDLAAAFAAAGFRYCALALDTSDDTLRSAVNLHAVGIGLDGYRELSGPDTYTQQVASGVAAFPRLSAEGISIGMYWLTVEDVSVGVRPDILVPAVAAACAEAEPYSYGLYSGFWYWPDYMGDTTQFSDRPLWDANWDQRPILEPVGYGGWAAAAVRCHQYASPVSVAGIGLDLDVWVMAQPIPTPPPPSAGIPANVLADIDDLAQWRASL